LILSKDKEGRPKLGLPSKLLERFLPVYFFVFFAFGFGAVFLEVEQGVPFGLQDMCYTSFMFIYNQNYHRKEYLSNGKYYLR
jgi:hypothetical protein